jgi:nicotinate phosphoribosyltransferase
MSFDDELESFRAYAEAMPNNCIFLVDTYDTLDGVRNAVEVGKWLRSHGHTLVGIRLDSGDLADLSKKAREILDSSGFLNTIIVGSNELDEYSITTLKNHGSPIAVWGVGTKLVTAYDHPALGGVYKLAAVRHPGEPWRYTIKISEETIKTTTPGILQVRRYMSEEYFLGDVMYDVEHGIDDGDTVRYLLKGEHPIDISAYRRTEDLLVPVFRSGSLLYVSPSLDEIRVHAHEQISHLPHDVRGIHNPGFYPVGLEPKLDGLKKHLIHKAQEK